MEGSMIRLFYFSVFSILLFINCGKQQAEENKKPPRAENAAPSTENAAVAYIAPLRQAVFVNGDKAMVFPGYVEEPINERAYPLLTEDSGRSWRKMKIETMKFKAINFNNLLQGWAISEDSELWKTTDGGINWASISRIDYGSGSVIPPSHIKFIDQFEGWCLNVEAILHTQDGGITWERREFPSFPLWLLRFQSRNTGWICVGNHPPEEPNAIYRTTNGGKAWEKIEIPETNRGSDDIHDLVFIDEQKGWLTNNRGIYQTTDGGTTWREQTLPGKGMIIWSLCFVNDQEGWAAGENITGDYTSEAVLLHTNNGGNSWQEVNTRIKGRRLARYFGERVRKDG